MSNHEARVVQHNLLHLDDPSSWVRANHHAVPSAVFTSPQVASVGRTVREAEEDGIPHRAVDIPLSVAGSSLFRDPEGLEHAVSDLRARAEAART